MKSEDEGAFVEKLRERLDRHAEHLDELTAARLRAMRSRALAEQPVRARRWLPVAGLATTAAALLAVLVWHQRPGEFNGLQEDWELLAAGEELELIEELEFYDWLEHTDSSS